ncbi:hypothetical protein ABOM_000742 [Aspergillus bombycis]|uniref:Xylanolytic transcriptional activator regulatory domain-containing protein n=1 Tax=Aspergillus bombycis TaxID=109264 RepID=A0A1F8AHK7_9EURO|nr:hypothetical protein ABOM_000742 [Aspergillus bombycis]OGM50778.1 hypothetical protein ABOM_000742 [Aspergillus bombycis]
MIAPGGDDRWQDHISKRTLERMVLGLMERKEHEQVLFQYQVCIYSKELFRISRWSTVRQNQALGQQLEQSQKYYKAAALNALKQISVLSSPTLVLLQSLLSGAMLMQFLGNMSQSWMLTSFAARTITFLGYQSLDTNASSESDIEIRACVFWCHYLDKVLSSLFMKPPSLPQLEVSPVLLLHLDSGSSSDVVRFMGHMACILEKALEVQLHPNQTTSKEQRAAMLDDLIQETNNLRTRIDKQQSRLSVSSTTKNDWVTAEFCSHTMLNNFFQSRFRLLQEKEDRGRCLESARKALSIFIDLQSSAVQSNPSQPDVSFLTWTILLFPLRPFFSLFCNVVKTSNIRDMQLMQSATSALEPFKTFIPADRLRRLFETLLDLCQPLFLVDMEISNQSAPGVDATAASISVQDSIEQLNANGRLTGPECVELGVDAAENLVGSEETVSSMPWGEEQMLDLFNSEPCLEWLEMVSFGLPQPDSND